MQGAVDQYDSQQWTLHLVRRFRPNDNHLVPVHVRRLPQRVLQEPGQSHSMQGLRKPASIDSEIYVHKSINIFLKCSTLPDYLPFKTRM